MPPVLAVMMMLLVAALAAAPGVQTRQAPPPAAQTVPQETLNARETREALIQTLSQYPPSLAHVLRLDPTLITNQAYRAEAAASSRGSDQPRRFQ